jgi:YcxB-like protein
VNGQSTTGRTVLAGMDHLQAVFWSAPRFFRLFGAATFGALAFALLHLGLGHSSFWWFYLFAVLLVATLATPAWLLLLHWRMSASQKDLTYTINAENIAIHDATGAVIVAPWSVVRSCIETSSGFIFYLRPAGARWLTKRAFTTDDVSALRSLTKSKLGEAAKLRVGR